MGQPIEATIIASGIVRCENGLAYHSPARVARAAAQVLELEPPPKDLREAFAILIGVLMNDARDCEAVERAA